jgi:hypothetical protein
MPFPDLVQTIEPGFGRFSCNWLIVLSAASISTSPSIDVDIQRLTFAAPMCQVFLTSIKLDTYGGSKASSFWDRRRGWVMPFGLSGMIPARWKGSFAMSAAANANLLIETTVTKSLRQHVSTFVDNGCYFERRSGRHG